MVGPYLPSRRDAFPCGIVSLARPPLAHVDVHFSLVRLKFCFVALFTVLSPEGDQT